MFGFLRKRFAKGVSRRMERFFTVAKMAIGLQLMRDLGFDSVDSDDDRKRLGEKGAVAVNYLFGKFNPVHAHLDLEAEHAAAREWLKRNKKLRELVVQSLRVTNAIGFA